MATITKDLPKSVKIPAKAESFELWCEICCNDSKGISIESIKKGDLVTIESLSGIGSFTTGKGFVRALVHGVQDVRLEFKVHGVVAIMAGVYQDGLSYYTKDKSIATNAAIRAQARKLEEELNKDVTYKRRDGYGQDPDNDDYENEGGIIVCMPTSKNVIYSTPKTQFLDGFEKHGRLPKYFSDNIKKSKSFFPCNKPGGQMSATAAEDGIIHILAFDSTFGSTFLPKFGDNRGTYEVKVNITRKSEKFSYDGSRAKLEEIKLNYLLHR